MHDSINQQRDMTIGIDRKEIITTAMKARIPQVVLVQMKDGRTGLVTKTGTKRETKGIMLVVIRTNGTQRQIVIEHQHQHN